MLEMSGISKRFPGVTALDSVKLSVGRGEVVALVGENGAGKSTLMKILAGIYRPDSGTIHFHGKPVSIRSPRESSQFGIGIIHQELEVIDTLDVAANIFLGREPTWAGASETGGSAADQFSRPGRFWRASAWILLQRSC